MDKAAGAERYVYRGKDVSPDLTVSTKFVDDAGNITDTNKGTAQGSTIITVTINGKKYTVKSVKSGPTVNSAEVKVSSSEGTRELDWSITNKKGETRIDLNGLLH